MCTIRNYSTKIDYAAFRQEEYETLGISLDWLCFLF